MIDSLLSLFLSSSADPLISYETYYTDSFEFCEAEFALIVKLACASCMEYVIAVEYHAILIIPSAFEISLTEITLSTLITSSFTLKPI